ncbi:MMPL family transporter [Actinomadura sp. HBU206391]|uniref:MMPL family transporter n=1 Tax=Actinomadura sp. HBU206391 TaxID=2731692 RepID=UPI0016507BC8|nr:MMPL family transporter [Actinomadura sp. HBU206391]
MLADPAPPRQPRISFRVPQAQASVRSAGSKAPRWASPIPDVTVAEVGIAVGIGVLIDTLLVRSIQVPALVIILG